MIVLKQLAREYDIDPYKLRAILRDEFGVRRRWRWEEDEPDLKKVRAFLKKAIATQPKPS